MDYTYTIESISTKQRYMRVRYSADGYPDQLQNFNPTAFDEPSLVALITARANAVIREWDEQEAQPNYDETSLDVTLSGSVTYTPPAPYEPSPEELVENAVNQAAFDRRDKEEEGVFWTDGTSTFFLDTTIDSQNRFSAARVAIEGGQRVDGAVWKLADVTSGSPVLTFRPTTNAELVTWAGLVHDFVQKCFQAEANAVQKIFGGDLTATFAQEFDAL